MFLIDVINTLITVVSKFLIVSIKEMQAEHCPMHILPADCLTDVYGNIYSCLTQNTLEVFEVLTRMGLQIQSGSQWLC